MYCGTEAADGLVPREAIILPESEMRQRCVVWGFPGLYSEESGMSSIPERNGQTMKTIKLEADLKKIPEVTDFVDREMENAGCSMKACMQMDVAIDEIFSNIARYAYAPGTGEAEVQFDFDAESGAVCVTFIDEGIPYNPLEKPDPDTSLSAEERSIGGLGIFLVKKTMDDMRYRYENGKNILSLIKKVSP